MSGSEDHQISMSALEVLGFDNDTAEVALASCDNDLQRAAFSLLSDRFGGATAVIKTEESDTPSDATAVLVALGCGAEYARERLDRAAGDVRAAAWALMAEGTDGDLRVLRSLGFDTAAATRALAEHGSLRLAAAHLLAPVAAAAEGSGAKSPAEEPPTSARMDSPEPAEQQQQRKPIDVTATEGQQQRKSIDKGSSSSGSPST
eukprot:m51a1_g13589 hypothetical protein (204) ;mRNA; f:1359-2115